MLSVVQLTSVADFRFSIEVIAALSQLTDREFHAAEIRNNCNTFAKRKSQFVKIGNIFEHARLNNDFGEFSRHILAPDAAFCGAVNNQTN